MSDREYDVEAVDEGAGVIMYCPLLVWRLCRARAWLHAHDIPFVEVDVEADPIRA